MRHSLIILLVLPALVLLAPAAGHVSAAAVGANPAEEAFNSVYSADMQRIKAGRDPKAAVELATRLLAAAKESRSQPAFQAVLCEKAYELAAPYPAGQALAVEAMTLLAACAPEKAVQSADCVAMCSEGQHGHPTSGDHATRRNCDGNVPRQSRRSGCPTSRNEGDTRWSPRSFAV